MRNFRIPIFLSVLIWGLVACQPQSPGDTSKQSKLEAREDSLELVAAYEAQTHIAFTVHPAVETHAVEARVEEDAADDPAFWLHPTAADSSLIFGSNKKGGIVAYNLKGEEVAYYPVGNINNIDVLQGFQMGEQRVDLLGGSNRSDQSVDLFLIDPHSGKLTDISASPFLVDTTELDDVYGFCFYKPAASGSTYLFLNAKNGRVRQYELQATEAGKIDLAFKRDILFESQVEGMVADEELGILYVGEEDKGIWKLSADPSAADKPAYVSMSGEDNPAIRYDVEGLSLYLRDTTGYLIASSQGNFSYAVFERNGSNAYIGSFKIMEKGSIDGVEETDGIQAIGFAIDSLYPAGVFIVQDGFNFQGTTPAAQNFKMVDWRDIEAVLQQQIRQ